MTGPFQLSVGLRSPGTERALREMWIGERENHDEALACLLVPPTETLPPAGALVLARGSDGRVSALSICRGSRRRKPPCDMVVEDTPEVIAAVRKTRHTWGDERRKEFEAHKESWWRSCSWPGWLLRVLLLLRVEHEVITRVLARMTLDVAPPSAGLPHLMADACLRYSNGSASDADVKTLCERFKAEGHATNATERAVDAGLAAMQCSEFALGSSDRFAHDILSDTLASLHRANGHEPGKNYDVQARRIQELLPLPEVLFSVLSSAGPE